MTEKRFLLLGASVAFTEFVRRQTAESHFSHWTISDDTMLGLIQCAAQSDHYKEGYRPGVVEVAIRALPGEFFTGVTELKDGTKLVGEHKARRSGEKPRTEIYVKRTQGVEKQEAVAVDIILYHHEVLSENDENDTDADWEIVSVNARTTYEPQPINPMTLMHNHFESDGGTSTNMSPEQFIKKLREGFEYWKDKAMLAPKEYDD